MIHTERWPRIRWILGAVSLAGFIIMSLLVAQHRTDWLDPPLIDAVQAGEHPRITQAAQVLSYIGSVIPMFIICLILAFMFYIRLRFRTELLLMLAVVAGSPILNSLLKWQFQRERPEIYRLAEAAGYSYPSGHAMSSVSFYGVLAYLLWRYMPGRAGKLILLAAAIVMMAAIGLSRIYLGVHYPSDIVGGYFAAAFWLTLCVAFYERRFGRTS
ncbi:phosphatase PAP2 family protein [Paenibacillus sp. 7541]|uniref:Phosphatase PAP2 family protein n=3 Tax=Paenibacillus TaxID=44249 RepID=A0A268ERM3_9BACL|nr:phosphatase PAP2 family protein [Paenibacillus sp. 7541]MUG66268.1 phosphatase PAP2 family protein [Paenibacillus campinasensis]PAD75770.1 hypothetical protein CHH67_14100 [Paenibacillus campinasensis]PAK54529.1 hypothetical protein CHH75_06645 [Paenibacillus sp. 7541]